MKTYQIAAIPADGIGPEHATETVQREGRTRTRDLGGSRFHHGDDLGGLSGAHAAGPAAHLTPNPTFPETTTPKYAYQSSSLP